MLIVGCTVYGRVCTYGEKHINVEIDLMETDGDRTYRLVVLLPSGPSFSLTIRPYYYYYYYLLYTGLRMSGRSAFVAGDKRSRYKNILTDLDEVYLLVTDFLLSVSSVYAP